MSLFKYLTVEKPVETVRRKTFPGPDSVQRDTKKYRVPYVKGAVCLCGLYEF